MNPKGLNILFGVLAIIGIVSYFGSNQLNLSSDSNDLDCGFTDDFISFLDSNGYGNMNFQRNDLKCGAYGGKISSSDKINKIPIVFIHGNSDVAFGRGAIDGYVSWQTGFRSLATYFTQNIGYSKGELYTTTWGPANPNAASNNYHSKEYILRIRNFLEAVLKYTGAPKVHIIGHSMGVTIGRKVVKGGAAVDHSAGNYYVGTSLKDRVATFIGLAGANLGLNSCVVSQVLPTCNSNDGFFPGLTPISAPSKFLNDLNKSGGPQADKVYTIWSQFDDLIGQGCVVWGQITSRINDQMGEIKKATIDWTHFAIRDKTGPDIISWL